MFSSGHIRVGYNTPLYRYNFCSSLISFAIWILACILLKRGLSLILRREWSCTEEEGNIWKTAVVGVKSAGLWLHWKWTGSAWKDRDEVQKEEEEEEQEGEAVGTSHLLSTHKHMESWQETPNLDFLKSAVQRKMNLHSLQDSSNSAMNHNSNPLSKCDLEC